MTNEIRRISVDGFAGIPERIDIEPDGRSLILLSGPNESGKTSCIQAVIETLAPKGKRMVPKPVNDFRDKAVTTIETDEWTSEVTHAPTGERKVVIHKHGTTSSASGVAFLKEQVGLVFIDPSEFIRLDEKRQREQLLSVVELPFSLEEHDAKIKAAEDERTRLNAVRKMLKGKFDAMPVPATGGPKEEMSIESVNAEYQAAIQANAEMTAKQNRQIDIGNRGAAIDAEINELTQRLVQLNNESAELKDESDELDMWLLMSPGHVDVDSISAKIDSIGAHNAAVQAAGNWRAARKESEVAEAEAKKGQKLVEDLNKEKVNAINGVEFPVEGLSVDDEGLLIDGRPFSAGNSAKKILTAFAIQVALSPELRFAVIHDGESLDDNSVRALAAMAEAGDFFVLAERGRDPQAFGDISYTFSNGAIA